MFNVHVQSVKRKTGEKDGKAYDFQNAYVAITNGDTEYSGWIRVNPGIEPGYYTAPLRIYTDKYNNLCFDVGTLTPAK